MIDNVVSCGGNQCNINIHSENDTCPICLEKFESNDNILHMPVCKHRIHTCCELKAAQYDSRCPICRTKDPNLTTRQDDDIAMYTNLENLAEEHANKIRQYNRKRARVINKHSKLTRLKEQLKRERKNFEDKEKELEKLWMKIQRESWNNNPNILKLKYERRKYQRRTNMLCKRLEEQVEEKVGPKPDDFEFNIDFRIVQPI